MGTPTWSCAPVPSAESEAPLSVSEAGRRLVLNGSRPTALGIRPFPCLETVIVRLERFWRGGAALTAIRRMGPSSMPGRRVIAPFEVLMARTTNCVNMVEFRNPVPRLVCGS